MTDATRRRTAIHEAAHAVASVVLGVPVDYVSVRPGQTFSGITYGVQRTLSDLDGFDPFRAVTQQPAALRADIERKVMMTLAADIAVRNLGPGPMSGYDEPKEAEAIAYQTLARFGPRLAELIVAQETSEEPSEYDETKARDLVYGFAGPDAAVAYLEWIRADAGELVRRYQAAILRVADALERRAVLRGKHVAALVYPPKPKKGI